MSYEAKSFLLVFSFLNFFNLQNVGDGVTIYTFKTFLQKKTFVKALVFAHY